MEKIKKNLQLDNDEILPMLIRSYVGIIKLINIIKQSNKDYSHLITIKDELTVSIKDCLK